MEAVATHEDGHLHANGRRNISLCTYVYCILLRPILGGGMAEQ
jgi:hypothetical protein